MNLSSSGDVYFTGYLRVVNAQQLRFSGPDDALEVRAWQDRWPKHAHSHLLFRDVCVGVYIHVNVFAYMMSEVISVRVSREIKKELEAAGINTSVEVKRYLEELAWKTRSKRAVEVMNEVIRNRVKPSKKGFAASQVREDRDGHS
jgi:hypothetical protein